MPVQIQLRRDTAANWTSENPILAQGEAGWETDTNKLKFGNGSTAWNSLAYFGAAGAPTAADYLVGTAHADLSGEIVVGTTPGGELGGTWASPTVDASHSGSTHAATQAAAEATASGALSTHAGAADPHPGYVLESATRKGCEVSRTATQSIATASPTAISFTAADTTDTDGFHDPATNATRVTIPVGLGGWYTIDALAEHVGDLSSTGLRLALLEKNSAGTHSDANVISASGIGGGLSGGGDGWTPVSWTGKLAAGDYVELFFDQRSGANRLCHGRLQLIFLGA